MNEFRKMLLMFMLAAILFQSGFIEGTNDASGGALQFDCLPEGYKSTDVASYRQKRKSGDGYITIGDKLLEVKAHCRDSKLIDGKGREIKFFKFACYGNPPADYEEQRQKEQEELERLQKKYCVIVLECDPRIS